MLEIDYKKVINDLEEILKKAGEVVMKYYGKNIKIKNKKNNTPATIVDVLSEKILLKGLAKFGFPIISEEQTLPHRSTHKVYWLVDPLDGTENFLRQNTEFCIMVSLVSKSEPVLGIVYLPNTQTYYYAFKNGGCYRKKYQGISIRQHVSCKHIEKSTMVASRYHLSAMESFLSQELPIKKVIKSGSVGVKAVLIANGKAQIYAKKSDKMGSWDICAAEILVREAGGVVTNLKGNKLLYRSNMKNPRGFLITADKKIHRKVLNKLKKYQ